MTRYLINVDRIEESNWGRDYTGPYDAFRRNLSENGFHVSEESPQSIQGIPYSFRISSKLPYGVDEPRIRKLLKDHELPYI